MTAPTMAEVLAEHRLTIGRCTCGWQMPRNVPMLPAHEAHVAAALAAAGYGHLGSDQ